ncbi:MAG: FHA domain-containing protein [Thauera sp.]|nr:FHA domain-containing protein [Thauera sp.]
MAKLILSMDGLVLKEIELDKERITIGRKPDNDIQIDNLAISGHHAVITTILNDAFLEDQNSTNGSYVNGQPVKKHVLHDNDVIELGKYRLKYIASTSPGPGLSANEMVATAALKAFDMRALNTDLGMGQPGGQTQLLPHDALEEAERALSGAPVGVIQVLNGSNAGRELELTKSLTTFGKPGHQVAVITRRPQGYFIAHVEGIEFPRLNGEAIGAQAHLLADHDIIDLGRIKMEFYLRS